MSNNATSMLNKVAEPRMIEEMCHGLADINRWRMTSVEVYRSDAAAAYAESQTMIRLHFILLYYTV
jgi:hypothetical protein